ncbi:hypothetical protein CAP35_13100 [Chitinophagaceae bacterium IBVUCB1]|nr:hypothetical protein CAP35_13100 [Chitinophagaceae bacterium IBVUCB1]
MGDVYYGKLVLVNNFGIENMDIVGGTTITLAHKWSNATEGILNDNVLDANTLSPVCKFTCEEGTDDYWEFTIDVKREVANFSSRYTGTIQANYQKIDASDIVLVNLYQTELEEIKAEFVFPQNRIRDGVLTATPLPTS